MTLFPALIFPFPFASLHKYLRKYRPNLLPPIPHVATLSRNPSTLFALLGPARLDALLSTHTGMLRLVLNYQMQLLLPNVMLPPPCPHSSSGSSASRYSLGRERWGLRSE